MRQSCIVYHVNFEYLDVIALAYESIHYRSGSYSTADTTHRFHALLAGRRWQSSGVRSCLSCKESRAGQFLSRRNSSLGSGISISWSKGERERGTPTNTHRIPCFAGLTAING
jgi:hypothetical protein